MDYKNLLRFYPVTHNSQLNYIWGPVEELLQKALDRSRQGYSIKEVRQMLEKRELLLHVVYDNNKICMVFTTQILGVREGKSLAVIHLAGGGDKDWKQTFNYLSHLGRLNGCTNIALNGRRGWTRRLKHLGFKEQSVIVAADI